MGDFKGFTLAELLIALAILGIIATFSIPKVLQAQQNQTYRAIEKEAASTISAAFQAHQLQKGLSPSTNALDLTPYLNYVSLDATSEIDNYQGAGTLACSSAVCLKLHNGATIYTYSTTFNGTAKTNAIFFYVDPDGKNTDNTTNGPGKSVVFFIYYNGHISTYADLLPGTQSSYGAHSACPSCDPPWFGWN